MCSEQCLGGLKSSSSFGAGRDCPWLLLVGAGESGSSVVGDAHRQIGDRRLMSALVYLYSQSCGDADVRVERGCRSKILSSWWPARAAKACRT
jgi:hypothetical protein